MVWPLIAHEPDPAGFQTQRDLPVIAIVGAPLINNTIFHPIYSRYK